MNTASNNIIMLEDIVSRQIAAGEVVERPASALRELIDNGIDANAKHIEVTVKGGGIELLQIADDGDGMSPANLLLCCKSHATSKIQSLSDLQSITSMGFRGEALASISAIARVTITSRTHNTEAHSITVEESAISKPMLASRERGTTIRIENMFYTVPARRKFLSHPTAELKQIRQVFFKKAASFPDISFTLNAHNNPPVHIPKESPFARSIRITASDNPSMFVWQEPVTIKNISLSGAMGLADIAQRTKRHIHIYINKRPIKDYALLQAIEFAYRNVLHGNVFPQVVLFLEIPPQDVDVNVHPTKQEVRIIAIDRVRKLIISTLESLLHPYSSATPSMQFEQTAIPTLHSNPVQYTAHSNPAPHTTIGTTPSIPATNTTKHHHTSTIGPSAQPGAVPLFSRHTSTVNSPLHNDGYMPRISPAESTQILQHMSNAPSMPPSTSQPAEVQQYMYIGTVFDTYSIFEHDTTILLLDFHATHERIIFDALKNDTRTTPLVAPVPLQFDSDLKGIQSAITTYRTLGIVIEQKDEQYVLTEIPANCPLTADHIASLIEELPLDANISAEFFARRSCRYAAKAGDHVDAQGAYAILASAIALDEPRCPHGRPLWITLEKKILDKMIGRIP